MLATLEKQDIDYYNADTVTTNRGGVESIDLPDDVQASLDNLLDNYRCQDELSDIHLKGDPLTVCHTLSDRILKVTPENLVTDAKILINHIIQEIITYCRETNTKSLNCRFSFSRPQGE